MLQTERGIELDFIPVTEDGLLDMDVYKSLLNRTPKLVSFTHMSNVLGTINPVGEIIKLAHAAGAVTLVDGAQSVPHLSVDVQALDADFYAFSAHKMCGPTGIGVLYGKSALLEAMPPFLGGVEADLSRLFWKLKDGRGLHTVYKCIVFYSFSMF